MREVFSKIFREKFQILSSVLRKKFWVQIPILYFVLKCFYFKENSLLGIDFWSKNSISIWCFFPSDFLWSKHFVFHTWAISFYPLYRIFLFVGKLVCGCGNHQVVNFYLCDIPLVRGDWFGIPLLWGDCVWVALCLTSKCRGCVVIEKGVVYSWLLYCLKSSVEVPCVGVLYG